MRKILLSVCACFLLVSVSVQADMTQNGRQPRVWDQAVSSVKLQSAGTDYTDNTSVFANIAVTGNNATGNTGYITFTAFDGNGKLIDYYLWVDASTVTTGQLRMASLPQLLTNTSFPYGDWRASTGFTSGVKVSAQ